MEKKLIAVVGMAGRFPKADSASEFWENLLEGRDCITRQMPIVTEEEGYSCVQAYGKMEGIYEFDHTFFDIGSADADLMEPQERLLLECAYHALEDAGYVGSTQKRKVGIICGAQENEYYLKNRFEQKNNNRLMIENQKFLNSGVSLAGRIAFKLNLTGPCMIVNTACSTSLTAVHLAADMIQSGQADMMLAGGANVSIQQENYVHMEGMSSKDGVVRPFDAHSSGFVPGSGLGLVVLKSYEQAVKDKDNIYAVILGGAVGNDGNRKIGYTAPSVQGECEVIQEALEKAGLTENEVDYIETHGTATVLGDCVEIRALKKVFESADSAKRIPIGSLKGNYGHLNSAAGIAGFMKAAMMIEHQVIPPSIHCQEENEELKECDTFYVNRSVQSGKKQTPIRHVGVSSFGIGGMNTHMILGKPQKTLQKSRKRGAELLVYSAKRPDSLEAYREKLIPFAEKQEDMGQVSYTSLLRRQVYENRGYMLWEKGMLKEPPETNGKKVMLQICGDDEVQAYVDELMDSLPGFQSAYEEAWNKEEEACHMTRMKKSYLKAMETVMRNMGFTCKTPEESGGETASSDAEFCVYLGEAWSALTETQEQGIYLLQLNQKGNIWSLLLQFMGCVWLKENKIAWELLFFPEQQQVCSLPGYCFSKITHRIAFEEKQSEAAGKAPSDRADYSEIYQFFREEAETEQIEGRTRLEDLNMDSMMVLVMKSKIAERFHCAFSIQDFYECDTVADVVGLVKSRVEDRNAPALSEQYEDIEDLFEDL